MGRRKKLNTREWDAKVGKFLSSYKKRKRRAKSPAFKKKRKTFRRKRAARRIQRVFRRYKRKKATRRVKKKSSFKKKMNVVAKRVNTYLEPRVIRHGWTPVIGGGMGSDDTGNTNIYNLPGNNPATATTAVPTGFPGILNWMLDLSTAPLLKDCALLQPQKRHNPLLYMRVETANDVNFNPNVSVNPNPSAQVLAYATCQPRMYQNGQGALVPQNVSPGGFVGGAFTGGYDSFEQPYYRPISMMNTARLFQTTEDCIAYKQFPFIPRIEKDFDDVKYNGSLSNTVGSNQIPMMTSTGTQANRFQRLEKWETRDGDKILVRNNYHKFDIEIFPDLSIELPVQVVSDHMPGLPKNYGQAGTLNADLTTTTQGGIDTDTQSGTTKQKFPGYIHKHPKWFCKVRFVVAQRQRKYSSLWGDNTLRFIGCRNNTLTTGSTIGRRPGVDDHLYSFKDFFQKNCLVTALATPGITNYGDWLNTPEPGRPAQGQPMDPYAYKPSYLFDKRRLAREVWKATKTRADKKYKSKISGLVNSFPQPPQVPPSGSYLMSNPEDPTLKIIYDKEIMLSGKQTTYTHIMNTMKGKVIEYLKEANPNIQTNQPVNTAGVQDDDDQNRLQHPIDKEYRFWVVVHCHNCRMQMKADHVFKFDA